MIKPVNAAARSASRTQVEFTADHWTVAADAFIAYGKRRHRASLNFGDCMAYAVAKLAGQPLLCLGDDFPATDLELA
jgi:ribonuclease VapC